MFLSAIDKMDPGENNKFKCKAFCFSKRNRTAAAGAVQKSRFIV
ncbi:hypothetical protein SS05631_b53400 (plasmid) [Sinorhizobium sp. CCBAU 05631]|nr:hypothetical protein SS05631_b53400 [Sinorhizobium sp. CCBAU 05631]